MQTEPFAPTPVNTPTKETPIVVSTEMPTETPPQEVPAVVPDTPLAPEASLANESPIVEQPVLDGAPQATLNTPVDATATPETFEQPAPLPAVEPVNPPIESPAESASETAPAQTTPPVAAPIEAVSIPAPSPVEPAAEPVNPEAVAPAKKPGFFARLFGKK